MSWLSFREKMNISQMLYSIVDLCQEVSVMGAGSWLIAFTKSWCKVSTHSWELMSDTQLSWCMESPHSFHGSYHDKLLKTITPTDIPVTESVMRLTFLRHTVCHAAQVRVSLSPPSTGNCYYVDQTEALISGRRQSHISSRVEQLRTQLLQEPVTCTCCVTFLKPIK